jgi:hypothetical protein
MHFSSISWRRSCCRPQINSALARSTEWTWFSSAKTRLWLKSQLFNMGGKFFFFSVCGSCLDLMTPSNIMGTGTRVSVFKRIQNNFLAANIFFVVNHILKVLRKYCIFVNSFIDISGNRNESQPNPDRNNLGSATLIGWEV